MPRPPASAPYRRLDPVLDRLAVAAQYPLPQGLLNRLMYRLTRARIRWWKDWQIRWFIRRYQVDMTEVAEPDPARYPDFNSFFTRALCPGARPIVNAPQAVACPVDGLAGQRGVADGDTLLQAKGRRYRLQPLLGSAEHASWFLGGTYATLYLAPQDYHRVHMPLSGQLRSMTHIPGRFFSVNPRTTRTLTGLFNHNERLVTLFDTPAGPMAVVLVGALFVGGLETVWSGAISRSRQGMRHWRYEAASAPHLERGDELGRFNMGSTVVVLFPPGQVQLDAEILPGNPIRMGQPLGTLTPDASGATYGGDIPR